MDQELYRAFSRWMAAEEADREDEAEAAFHVVARAVPRMQPAAGTAAQILLSVRRARARRALRARAIRVASVAAASVATIALGYFAVTEVGPFLIYQAVKLLELAFEAFVWTTLAFNNGVNTWAVLARAGRAIGAAMGAPEVSTILVSIELIGALALYGLHQLLGQEKKESG